MIFGIIRRSKLQNGRFGSVAVAQTISLERLLSGGDFNRSTTATQIRQRADQRPAPFGPFVRYANALSVVSREFLTRFNIWILLLANREASENIHDRLRYPKM